MLYLSQFQQGGSAPTITQILQKAAQEMQSQAPGQAVQAILQMMQDPQQSQQLEALAQQSPEINDLLMSITNLTTSQKCGGKMKKKVNKAGCGKKLQDGKPITRSWESSKYSVKVGKSGCACQLKRVGGRLVNVDSCTGLPIAYNKNGNVLYADDGTELSKKTRAGYATLKDGSTAYVDDSGNIYYNNGRRYNSGTKKMENYDITQYQYDPFYYKKYKDENSTSPFRNTMRYMHILNPLYYKSSENKTTNNQQDTTQPQMTAGERMFRNSGVQLSDYSLKGRRNWLADQANADYLKGLNLGFDASNYTGTAAQNRALLSAIQGRSSYVAPTDTDNSVDQSTSVVQPTTTRTSISGTSTSTKSSNKIADQLIEKALASSNNDINDEVDTEEGVIPAINYNQNAFKKSKAGIWYNDNGEYDFKRSVTPDEYASNIKDMYMNPYRENRNALRGMYRDIVATNGGGTKGIKAYWDKVKALRNTRKADQANAEKAVADYRTRYTNYQLDKLGLQSGQLAMGKESEVSPTTFEAGPILGEYTQGKVYKQGGNINYLNLFKK